MTKLIDSSILKDYMKSEKDYLKITMQLNQLKADSIRNLLEKYNYTVLREGNIVTVKMDNVDIQFICYSNKLLYLVRNRINSIDIISNEIHPSTVAHTESLENKFNKIIKKSRHIDIEITNMLID